MRAESCVTFTRRFSASLVESLIIQRVRFHRIADKFLSSGAPFLRARRGYGFWKKLRELRSLVDATTTLMVDLAYLSTEDGIDRGLIVRAI